MQTSVIEIGHFDILTKFHKGLSEQECLVISHLTKVGYCVYLVCEEDGQTITDYHVYNRFSKEDGLGQIISGDKDGWQTFKNNKYDSYSET